MNIEGVTFHHFGLAVRKEDAALKFLRCLGYSEGNRIYDTEQNVYVRLCVSKNMPAVEIVTPANGVGPLDPILQRSPEMIYHSCYQTHDLERVLAFFSKNNIRCICISPPRPAILFGYRLVSFYYIPGFGLIELLEKPEHTEYMACAHVLA